LLAHKKWVRIGAQARGEIVNIDGKQIIEYCHSLIALVGIDTETNRFTYEMLDAPHTRPSSLPSGEKAIYIFMLDEACLKVGKAGAKSKARFTSQHYNPNSSPSNLAKSILKDKSNFIQHLPGSAKSEALDINEHNIGEWIEKNTSRHHIFMDERTDRHLFSLIEVFMQCKFHPIYEGA